MTSQANERGTWWWSAGPFLANAFQLAERAHAGQVDKAGSPYIFHVSAVAMALRQFGDNAMAAGLLHDVIEDTDVTLDDLRTAGYPDEVVRAVDSVSRRKDEPYDDLIVRAAGDPLGRLVKLADNAHNADPKRLLLLPEDDRARLAAKYARARELILDRNRDLLALAERAAARYRVDLPTVIRDGFWNGPSNSWAIWPSVYCDRSGGDYPCELHREHAGGCLEID